jgi:hypothetical protein
MGRAALYVLQDGPAGPMLNVDADNVPLAEKGLS